MNNPVKSLIESRISANYYDTGRQLTDDEIKMLVDQATRAPSSYNFQNWKFIAVRTQEGKERLKSLSYGQQKVADAAVTFIVCGTLKAYEQLPATLQLSVDAGIIDNPTREAWVKMATQAHINNPGLQRDEAIRSASLAAMTLMLAAQGMGLASGPMGGFDASGVAKEFNLAETEVPVMLVTVGYLAAGNWSQKPRRAVEEVMVFA